jgi:hypothetical protein
MSDMKDVPATDDSAVDAEDSLIVPGDFPCDIALARLRKESAVANRVDFLFPAIEADGAPLECEEFVLPYLNAKRANSMKPAIAMR